MDTLSKILKCYSDIYSPPKQFTRALKSNFKIWGTIIMIYLIEIGFMFRFLLVHKELWYALLMYIVFLITVFVVTYWDFSEKARVFGSLQHFDERKLQNFCSLTLNKTQINLNLKNENNLVEELLKMNLETRHRKKQTLLTNFLALFSTVFIPIVNLVSDNKTGILLLSVIIGLIIVIFTTIRFFKVTTILNLNIFIYY